MFITIAIIAAVLIVVYLYFLLNKAVEEPEDNSHRKVITKRNRNKIKQETRKD